MPPCPTSSSTSYRPAIVSPTTDEKLPGGRSPYSPQARAEPEAAAPDCVEQQDEADREPQRWARVRVCGACGRHSDDPREGEHAADDEKPGASEAERAEGERQQTRRNRDHEPGHPCLYRLSAAVA